MTLKSKFKVENPVVFLFSVFYVVAGIAQLSYSVIENFTAPPDIGVLGFLSLITAYGLFKMRKWSVLLVTALFFLGIAFCAPILYRSIVIERFLEDLLLNISLIAYLIMTLIAFLYVATKRKDFK